MWGHLLQEFSLEESVSAEIDSWEVTVFPDGTCPPHLGHDVGGVGGGRRGACPLVYWGEQLSQPRRGWMIKQEMRDSWLN